MWTGRLAHEDLGDFPEEVYGDLRRGLLVFFRWRRHIVLSLGCVLVWSG